MNALTKETREMVEKCLKEYEYASSRNLCLMRMVTISVPQASIMRMELIRGQESRFMVQDLIN